MMQFPEMSLWRDLLDKLRTKVWTADEDPNDAPKAKSKWDDKSAKTSKWATTWRKVIKYILPRGMDGAAVPTDRDLRLLAAAIWKEVAEWAQKEELERQLALFTAEPPGLFDPAQGSEPAQWAFVPAADLLLAIGEGLVGNTAEGWFANGGPGHERRSFEAALKRAQLPDGGRADSRERDEKEEKDKDRSKEKDKDRKRDDDDRKRDRDKEKKNDPNFDWESVWRARVAKTKGSRRTSGWGSRSRTPPRRRRSRSRDRGRRCSRSRERRRSRSRR